MATCNFNRLQEELSGSDLPLRPILYDRMKNILVDIEAGKPSDLMNWVTDDVTLITHLDTPGGIFKGKNELRDHFQNDFNDVFRICGHRTEVPTLIIVDRGRITCHLERFSIDDDDENLVMCQHVLAIFDLDGASRIKRIEYRLLFDSSDTSGRTLDQAITEAKKRAFDIDHTASF